MSTRQAIYVQRPQSSPWPAGVGAIGGGDQGEAELAFAFRKAGDIIAERWADPNSFDRDDSMLIPMLYNYRHALELWLKLSVGMLLQVAHFQLRSEVPNWMEDMGRRLNHTHSLKTLAQDLTRLAGTFKVGLSESQNQTLLDMDEVDATGQSLRYVMSHGKDGLSITRPELVFVDVPAVVTRLGEACDDLDSLVDSLQDMQDGLLTWREMGR